MRDEDYLRQCEDLTLEEHMGAIEEYDSREAAREMFLTESVSMEKHLKTIIKILRDADFGDGEIMQTLIQDGEINSFHFYFVKELVEEK